MTVVVANPAAQGGRVGKQKARIEALLRDALGPVEVRWTTAAADAPRFAREAVEAGVDRVMSLGGDGTHSAVVNGIMAAGLAPGAVTLGILPAGTGGDFRRLLVHGETLERAAGVLAEAQAAPVDVGALTWTTDDGGEASGWFLNIASFGIGGLVDRFANTSSKRLGGKASFAIATARALARYRPARVRLVLDGEVVEPGAVTNVLVCNGRFGGGGMMFAPDALLDDGLFDVVVLRHVSLLHTATSASKVYSGAHLRDPSVSVHRARRVEATVLGDDPAWLDLDGEAPGRAPLTATVVPGALRLLDPRPTVLAARSS